jgi:hypothetical protein
VFVFVVPLNDTVLNGNFIYIINMLCLPFFQLNARQLKKYWIRVLEKSIFFIVLLISSGKKTIHVETHQFHLHLQNACPFQMHGNYLPAMTLHLVIFHSIWMHVKFYWKKNHTTHFVYYKNVSINICLLLSIAWHINCSNVRCRCFVCECKRWPVLKKQVRDPLFV